jgi:hypothetical protein
MTLEPDENTQGGSGLPVQKVELKLRVLVERYMYLSTSSTQRTTAKARYQDVVLRHRQQGFFRAATIILTRFRYGA